MAKKAVNHVQRYVDDVLSGRIKTGRTVQHACRRHNDDKKSTRWYFSLTEANRAIDFIETFCSISKGSTRELKLTLWQKFIIGSIFGWLERDTEVRKYRQALIMIARKNGKSLLLSAISLYCLLADGERGAEIYCLSNTQKQARIIHDETKQMINSNASLNRNLRSLRDTVYFDRTASKFEPRASDSGKLDGLNTHLGIFDEIHEFKDRKLISVIKNSQMSRRQPLLIFITTAGFVLDGVLVEEYEQGLKTLSGQVEDDRVFYYIAELDPEDDINDSTTWIKANPNLGVSISLESMIEDWNRDKEITSAKVDFITKRLNKFVEWNDKTFIDYEIMKRNTRTFDLDELRGKNVVIGIDASVSGDLTSVVFEFDLGDTIAIRQMTFLPRTKLTAKNNDRYSYNVAIADGDAMLAGEESVDMMVVYEYIVQQVAKHGYQVLQVNYDRAYAQELIAKLRNHFLCVEIRQGHVTLSEPMSDLRKLLMNGEVAYNGSKLMSWYTTNVECRYDVNANIAPDKKNSYFGSKIDGFSAWLNAHVTTYERRLNGLNNEPSFEVITF